MIGDVAPAIDVLHFVFVVVIIVVAAGVVIIVVVVDVIMACAVDATDQRICNSCRDFVFDNRSVCGSGRIKC